MISNYCSAAPNATVSNSVIVGTYGNELSTISTIDCAIGFSANGSSSNATCTAYTETHGEWSGLDLTCTRICIFVDMCWSRRCTVDTLIYEYFIFIHHNPHGFCKIRAENPIYCPLTPPGQPTYYRGSTNQIIYSYSTLGCALGYQADITGYPVYYCRPYNTSNGVYTLVSGDCARTTFFVLSFS